ncbi:hypothetical protein BJ508DRAFT_413091 [Ascobolus immersus RN42]|uniref:Uncharacterized protein n=1 Tax=Ascobolus immersus RN42 TaxID=1160509 RepID=A0A3N4ID82_ASCIM|nr:hypothetical protein BJ508DRAFT_413091 [Ascobolus immersus RN42]
MGRSSLTTRQPAKPPSPTSPRTQYTQIPPAFRPTFKDKAELQSRISHHGTSTNYEQPQPNRPSFSPFNLESPTPPPSKQRKSRPSHTDSYSNTTKSKASAPLSNKDAYEERRIQQALATKQLLLDHIKQHHPTFHKTLTRGIDDIFLADYTAGQRGYRWRCSGGYSFPQRNDNKRAIKSFRCFRPEEHEALEEALRRGWLECVVLEDDSEMEEETHADDESKEEMSVEGQSPCSALNRAQNLRSGRTSAKESQYESENNSDGSDSRVVNSRQARRSRRRTTSIKRYNEESPGEESEDVDDNGSTLKKTRSNQRRTPRSRKHQDSPPLNWKQAEAARFTASKTLLFNMINSALPGLIDSIEDVSLAPATTKSLGYVWEFKHGYMFPFDSWHKGGKFKNMRHFTLQERMDLEKAVRDGSLQVASVRCDSDSDGEEAQAEGHGEVKIEAVDVEISDGVGGNEGGHFKLDGYGFPVVGGTSEATTPGLPNVESSINTATSLPNLDSSNLDLSRHSKTVVDNPDGTKTSTSQAIYPPTAGTKRKRSHSPTLLEDPTLLPPESFLSVQDNLEFQQFLKKTYKHANEDHLLLERALEDALKQESGHPNGSFMAQSVQATVTEIDELKMRIQELQEQLQTAQEENVRLRERQRDNHGQCARCSTVRAPLRT